MSSDERKKDPEPDLTARFEEIDLDVPLSNEEAADLLTSAGIDAESALTELMACAEKLNEQLRREEFERAAVERRMALDKLETARPPRPRASLLEKIRGYIERGLQPQAMYKDLEEVTDEDLESLVAELEALAGDEEES